MNHQDFRARLERAAESDDPADVDHVLREQNAVSQAMAYHEEVTRLRRENDALRRSLERARATIRQVRALVAGAS